MEVVIVPGGFNSQDLNPQFGPFSLTKVSISNFSGFPYGEGTACPGRQSSFLSLSSFIYDFLIYPSSAEWALVEGLLRARH